MAVATYRPPALIAFGFARPFDFTGDTDAEADGLGRCGDP